MLKKIAKVLATITASAAIGIVAGSASAHTVSIGYENAGPGAVTFWYGSYHTPGENPAYATEGSMTLAGILGNPFASTTVPFVHHVSSKPGGLIDGTTNFYASGPHAGTGGLTPTYTLPYTIYRWQGVTFTGLAAGDYSFTYVPIASPTATWAPWNAAVLSNTVHLSGAIVQAPEPATLALFGLGLLGLGAARRRTQPAA